jgi:hypothetical protein
LRIRLEDGLPFVTALLSYQGQRIELQKVLLDTGSAGTVLSADALMTIGLVYEADDVVHRIRGIGGGCSVGRAGRCTMHGARWAYRRDEPHALPGSHVAF